MHTCVMGFGGAIKSQVVTCVVFLGPLCKLKSRSDALEVYSGEIDGLHLTLAAYAYVRGKNTVRVIVTVQ